MIPLTATGGTDGYAGMRWGSSLSELQHTKKLVLTKEAGADGAALYVLENEDMHFGSAKLTGIHCSFVQGSLHGVILLFKGAQDFTAVKKEAFARFGESAKHGQNGEEMYNWLGGVTTIVLSYDSNGQSGFLFMKSKKRPAASKKSISPPAQPMDVETALDKASEPPLPQKDRQVEASSAMEISLDRSGAPPPPQPAEAATAATATSLPAEIQALIDKDHALTRLCWGTTGPEAMEACRQMRQSMQQLTAKGMCMTPSEQGGASGSVGWIRCTGTVSPAATPSSNENRRLLCNYVGTMFAVTAQLRQNGASPGSAEEELIWQQDGEFPEITMERIRETVELVYFDQSYNTLMDDLLSNQVRERCLNGSGPYAHPLP